MLRYLRHVLSRSRARLRSRVSRAVEQRQQERTRSLVETPATHSPPKTDPQLAAYLNGDPDEEFEVARHTALDALRETDCVALWLQAISDGTPLDHAHGNHIEHATPHNALYLAGYDDELTYPELTQIAIQLFAHHVCIVTSVPRTPNPADEFETFQRHGREAIRNSMNLTTAAARQMYPEAASEEVPDLFEPQALADQRDRAIAILEDEDLSMFWVQVMTTAQTKAIAPPEGPAPDINVMADSSVEYVQARPDNADHDLAHQLAMETAGQHQYVVAQTADQSLDVVRDQGVPVALESGYLSDAMM